MGYGQGVQYAWGEARPGRGLRRSRSVNTGHRIVHPLSDDEEKQQIQEEGGVKREFAIEAFSDLEKDVRQPIRRI